MKAVGQPTSRGISRRQPEPELFANTCGPSRVSAEAPIARSFQKHYSQVHGSKAAAAAQSQPGAAGGQFSLELKYLALEILAG